MSRSNNTHILTYSSNYTAYWTSIYSMTTRERTGRFYNSRTLPQCLPSLIACTVLCHMGCVHFQEKFQENSTNYIIQTIPQKIRIKWEYRFYLIITMIKRINMFSFIDIDEQVFNILWSFHTFIHGLWYTYISLK